MAANRKRRLKVLHAPHDVGGNAYYLARAERAYGFDSSNLVYAKQWFGYPADYHLDLDPFASPMRYRRWWLLMAKVALSYDVLHFNFGVSFLTHVPFRWILPDLPLWRNLGLATFITFQGCDSRISRYVMQYLEPKICANCPQRQGVCQPFYDDFKLEIITEALRYADRVFALNPDLLHNIPGGYFLPYANCDLDDWQPPHGYDWHHSGPVRVLHAPTSQELKGSSHIIAAVEALRAEGENVELVLVENVPHGQVKELYESADLLVDQVLAGWYGGLAVELMALGKPVIAYLRQEDLGFIPAEMRADLPIINADAATLKETLREFIHDTERRQRAGAQSRAYVEKWHHPRVVAGITTAMYRQAVERRSGNRGSLKRLHILLKLAKPTLNSFRLIYGNNSALPSYITNWLGK
ncbi:MAG: hypothetical protein U0401_12970 [Anaerolineae bacterium]